MNVFKSEYYKKIKHRSNTSQKSTCSDRIRQLALPNLHLVLAVLKDHFKILKKQRVERLENLAKQIEFVRQEQGSVKKNKGFVEIKEEEKEVDLTLEEAASESSLEEEEEEENCDLKSGNSQECIQSNAKSDEDAIDEPLMYPLEPFSPRIPFKSVVTAEQIKNLTPAMHEPFGTFFTLTRSGGHMALVKICVLRSRNRFI